MNVNKIIPDSNALSRERRRVVSASNYCSLTTKYPDEPKIKGKRDWNPFIFRKHLKTGSQKLVAQLLISITLIPSRCLHANN